MKRSFVYSDEEHAGLATRAPVPPETPAGDDRLDADDRSRPRPDPRAEDDFLVEEVEEVVISQPGQEFQYSCPGCGKEPGKGETFPLDGPNRGSLRVFVEEKRKRYLENMGISYSPDNVSVSLQQMRICSTCKRQFHRSVEKSGDCQSNCPQLVEVGYNDS